MVMVMVVVTMLTMRFVFLVAARAIFTVVSIASEPLLLKMKVSILEGVTSFKVSANFANDFNGNDGYR